MSTLVIRLSASASPAEWLLTGADGAAMGGGAAQRPFTGQLAETEAARTVLIVPGEAVAGHSVHLPAAGEAQTRAAARFAIEDDLGVDAESVHLALGPAGAPGAARLVAVADREALEAWLEDARALGASPDAALPEWAAVPAGERRAGVLADGVAHVNFGAWGFSAEPDLAAAILPRALERFDAAAITLWDAEPEEVAPAEGWAGRDVRTEALPGGGALALLARGAASAGALNLLQGAYAPRAAGAISLVVWRRAAALLLGVVALGLGLILAQAAALNARADALNDTAEAAFAEAFPEVGRIVNPRLQMQTGLAELRGRGGGAFLDLSAILYAAVEAQEGAEIASLRYDRAAGDLAAELRLTDFAQLQALRDAVTSAGGVFEEGASRQEGGRVVGDVRVRLP